MFWQGVGAKDLIASMGHDLADFSSVDHRQCAISLAGRNPASPWQHDASSGQNHAVITSTSVHNEAENKRISVSKSRFTRKRETHQMKGFSVASRHPYEVHEPLTVELNEIESATVFDEIANATRKRLIAATLAADEARQHATTAQREAEMANELAAHSQQCAMLAEQHCNELQEQLDQAVIDVAAAQSAGKALLWKGLATGVVVGTVMGVVLVAWMG